MEFVIPARRRSDRTTYFVIVDFHRSGARLSVKHSMPRLVKYESSGVLWKVKYAVKAGTASEDIPGKHRVWE